MKIEAHIESETKFAATRAPEEPLSLAPRLQSCGVAASYSSMHLNNKENLRALREQIDAALKPIAEANGITLKCGNCTFDQTIAKFTLNAAEIFDDGTVASPERIMFTRACKVFGLEPEDLGKTVTLSNHTFTIVGLKPGCRLPVVIERDGKRFKAAADVIASQLHPLTPA